MGCERCNGWMSSGQYTSYNADGKLILKLRWRCVNCGNVVDSIIEQNRAASAVSVVAAAWRGK